MFTPAGIQTTELLAAQAAISLENARLVEEMKRAEEALAREREHLAVTLHSIGDAVIATDTDRSRVVMLNRVAEELTGWPRGRGGPGRPLAEVFRDRQRADRSGGGGSGAQGPRAGRGGRAREPHGSSSRRDGERRAIADSAAPIRGEVARFSGWCSCSATSPTARKAEEALRESEERLAVTLHSIGDAVIATDTDEPRGDAQPRGRGADRLAAGRSLRAGRSPKSSASSTSETGAPAEDPVRKVLESGGVVGLANHTALVSRDGSRLSIADSAAPIRGRGGEILGVVLVFRDVSEERRAEGERDATDRAAANREHEREHVSS